MPQTLEALESASFLRALVYGVPFAGKTHTCVSTCESPAYVICPDGASNLIPAKNAGAVFEWDVVEGQDAGSVMQSMQRCIASARSGVRDGKYKTIIVDTVSSYSERLEYYLGDKEDHGKSWYKYKMEIANFTEQLKTIPAHLIVLSHYVKKEAPAKSGQEKSSGQGITPLLAGDARATYAKRFDAVVMLEKDASGKRVFTTGDAGAFGLGLRNIPGYVTIDANIKLLWDTVKGRGIPASKQGK